LSQQPFVYAKALLVYTGLFWFVISQSSASISCLSTCTRTCTRAHTQTHTYAHTHTHTHTRTLVHAHTQAHTQKNTKPYLYTFSPPSGAWLLSSLFPLLLPMEVLWNDYTSTIDNRVAGAGSQNPFYTTVGSLASESKSENENDCARKAMPCVYCSACCSMC